MTPFARIENELHAQRKTRTQLAAHLGSSKQSISNWKTKGVPAKFYRLIDAFFGMPAGWTETGEISQPQLIDARHTERLKIVLSTIASAFKSIPEDQWGEALIDVSEVLSKRLDSH